MKKYSIFMRIMVICLSFLLFGTMTTYAYYEYVYTFNFYDTDGTVIHEPVTASFKQTSSEKRHVKQLPEPTVTKTGYKFTGWYRKTYPNVILTEFVLTTSSGSISTSGTKKYSEYFYAKWELVQYTIQFNANGGEGAPESIITDYEQVTSIPTKIPTRQGYEFLYWTTEADGTGVQYTPGSNGHISNDMTLYAQWEKLPVSVTGISLDKMELELNIGDTANLTYTISPADATNKNASWQTSNANVAICDNGVIRAVGEGVCVITVTATDGNYAANCIVTVIDISEPVTEITDFEVDITSNYAVINLSVSNVTENMVIYVAAYNCDGNMTLEYIERVILQNDSAVVVIPLQLGNKKDFKVFVWDEKSIYPICKSEDYELRR